MELVLASNNQHKYLEIKDILKPYGISLLNTLKINEDDIIEDALTFKDNAIIKARLYAQKFNCVVIADDSGIIVDCIAPLPGIYSKRYSGLGDYENNLKMLSVLYGQQMRQARFVCAIAIAFPDGKIFTYEGQMVGEIALSLKGVEGFGYDPIFIPENEVLTLAQLGAQYKMKHSHRRQAINEFLEAKDEIIDYWRYTWQK